ncbi:MAG: PHP domain-containing protein [Candidatus Moeniiplasma glomeromycotorum]|nr:PHP domain-containing protein [Candidatus Moeniiplasma glomeromycotorum]MCE8162589.1 PHP domain-containing protein [Candidatus Moeniiplasma glomeromycotorum]MCE8166487.1 PHP domain-containing protein [Candidatus Moeniiplasma glomeromycotorum]MCE8166972.1 PHP domain-containing protein [Candidatus Moeniiplasma glomeromycotorum]
MEINFLPHLNVQTNSNLSFSFLTIPQLVDWAHQNKLNCLAIADYYPYEITEFFNLCKTKKIKPIWGVKIFLESSFKNKKHLVTIFPRNNKGYKEVIYHLFSPETPADRTFTSDYILSQLSENCLIVLEAQKLEEIKYFATQWIFASPPQKEINYSHLFIGFKFLLSPPTKSFLPLWEYIVPRLLPFFSVKVLAQEETKLLALWKKTTFGRYFFPSDSQETFLAYLDTQEYFSQITNDHTFYQLLLTNWEKFLSLINLSPSFRTGRANKKKKENAFLTLQNKCLQKLVLLQKKKENKYQETLTKELKIIKELDYSDYFLVFSDVVDHLQKKDIIVGPGRGSSVSSLVAYLLGITKIDPLQHNLFFARFLNEKRKTLPDIDLDVENQEEVFNYLQEKYPKNQVARIITKEKIGWKIALQKSITVCQGIEKNSELRNWKIISASNQSPDFSNLGFQRLAISYPFTFSLAKKIADLSFSTGVHPAGIVISDYSLTQISVPVKKEKNFLLSLYDKDKLAQIGLKKYDFLSLKETFGFINFSFIREVKEFLRFELPTYQDINLQDKKTWELFSNFFVTDIFQLDTISARKMFINFRPKNFSDLIIFLGLNRPGIREMISKEVIQAKNNKEEPTFFSPVIKKILAETYGFIIFEEQISQILAFVYGYSFEEAEVKRRELPKKGWEKEFLPRAYRKMSVFESKLIYQQINSTIGYIFNKAHAVAYSYLTYYTAYLKANFFSEIITNLLNKKKEKTLSYLQEAFFYGFQIEGPDINYSEIEWTKQDKKLILGFSHLKEYQSEFFQALIKERVRGGLFSNWENLLNRTISHWGNLKTTAFEEWVKSGLFKSLQVEADILLDNKENFFRYLHIRQKIDQINNPSETKTNLENHLKQPQTSLNSKAPIEFIQTLHKFLPFLDLSSQKAPVASKLTVNQQEWESLGLYVSYFSRWKIIAQKTEFKIDSLLNLYSKIEEYNNQEGKLNIYAIIRQLEKKEPNGYTLSLQDVRSSFKLEITEQIYQINQEKLAIHNELLFSLKFIVKERRIFSLVCEKIEDLS